jgi:hypothetical protein
MPDSNAPAPKTTADEPPPKKTGSATPAEKPDAGSKDLPPGWEEAEMAKIRDEARLRGNECS